MYIAYMYIACIAYICKKGVWKELIEQEQCHLNRLIGDPPYELISMQHLITRHSAECFAHQFLRLSVYWQQFYSVFCLEIEAPAARICFPDYLHNAVLYSKHGGLLRMSGIWLEPVNTRNCMYHHDYP